MARPRPSLVSTRAGKRTPCVDALGGLGRGGLWRAGMWFCLAPFSFTLRAGTRSGVLTGGGCPAFAAVCMGEHEPPVFTGGGIDPSGRTSPPAVVRGCPCAPRPADAVPEAVPTQLLSGTTARPKEEAGQAQGSYSRPIARRGPYCAAPMRVCVDGFSSSLTLVLPEDACRGHVQSATKHRDLIACNFRVHCAVQSAAARHQMLRTRGRQRHLATVSWDTSPCRYVHRSAPTPVGLPFGPSLLCRCLPRPVLLPQTSTPN